MDDVNDTLTNSFVSGADEITTSVSERVKMKIQYKQMCQRNVTTGWSRDIRCVSRDQADTQSSNVEWEWEDMNGVWERCCASLTCLSFYFTFLYTGNL